jgi:hypothetical protein
MKFFKKNNKIAPRIYSENELVEIHTFHLMLLKMKKRRPDLDVKKMMDALFPNNNLNFK